MVLLKAEYLKGFEIKVMENPTIPKGEIYLYLSPEDYAVIYKKVQDESKKG